MHTRHPPTLPPLLLLLPLVPLLVGCGGPTHTAGTRGVAASNLAVLTVPQLPGESPVQIESIRFDGADEAHAVGKGGRDFYLTPGDDHTATFTLIARPPRVSGVGGWFGPKVPPMRIPVPTALPLGALTAGKRYELMTGTDGFDQSLQSGRMSLVREKPK